MRDVDYRWAAPKYYLFQWHCIVFKSYLCSSCVYVSQVNQGCFSWLILVHSVPTTFLFGITSILQLNLGPIKRNYSIAHIPWPRSRYQMRNWHFCSCESSHQVLLDCMFNTLVNCSGKTRREYSLVRNSVACFETKSIKCFFCWFSLSTDWGETHVL